MVSISTVSLPTTLKALQNESNFSSYDEVFTELVCQRLAQDLQIVESESHRLGAVAPDGSQVAYFISGSRAQRVCRAGAPAGAWSAAYGSHTLRCVRVCARARVANCSSCLMSRTPKFSCTVMSGRSSTQQRLLKLPLPPVVVRQSARLLLLLLLMLSLRLRFQPSHRAPTHSSCGCPKRGAPFQPPAHLASARTRTTTGRASTS